MEAVGNEAGVVAMPTTEATTLGVSSIMAELMVTDTFWKSDFNRRTELSIFINISLMLTAQIVYFAV